MGSVRYSVACSLDGYIAGPTGEYDWIIVDPDIDFGALFSRYDAMLIGRRSYEVLQAGEGDGGGFDMEKFVFSRTLDPAEHSDVTVVAEDAGDFVRELKRRDGKDVWLFGGGELFRSLLAEGVVDGIEVAVIPILLGGGIPLLPSPADRVRLRLEDRRIYEATGTVWLDYAID